MNVRFSTRYDLLFVAQELVVLFFASLSFLFQVCILDHVVKVVFVVGFH